MKEKKSTVLIVDSEPESRKLLKVCLESNHYKHVEATRGAEALHLAASLKPELIMIDLDLPDMDGKHFITAVRQITQAPVIVCSTRAADQDIIDALYKGADDYLVKPFNPQILLARMHANLRKAAITEGGNTILANGRIRVDLIRHKVFIDDKKTFFTPKEYMLLRYFMINKERIITHSKLLKEIWGPVHINDIQYLRVYIGQIRQKIEPDPNKPVYIVTEPGVGYRMDAVSQQPKREQIISFPQRCEICSEPALQAR